MVFFKFLKKVRKTTSTVDFELIEEKEKFTLENQSKKIDVVGESDIYDMFTDFSADNNQFVILEAPKAINKIRYVQACHTNGIIEVQIGLENGGKINLYRKYFSFEESRRIFADFYNNKFAPNLKKYKPVKFR